MIGYFVILGITVILVIGYILYEKFDGGFGALYSCLGFFMSFAIVVLIIATVMLVVAKSDSDADLAYDIQRYNSLNYQLKTHMYEDSASGDALKSLMDDVKHWNEYVASRQLTQKNPWLSFMIDDYYDELKLIPLE